jgi:ATP-dependent DNA helicase RecG
MRGKTVLLERESKTIKYQRDLPSNFSPLIKTCVGFANSAGGKIFIGVEDKTLEIHGVSEKELNHAMEAFGAAVYEAVSPALISEVYSQRMNDKELIVIEVSRGSSPPYFVKAQGSKKGVYVRVGPTTRVASDEHIAELFSMRTHSSYDSEATNEAMDSLDPKLLQEAYGKAPSQNLLLNERVLIKSITKKVNVTNAAILAFGTMPQETIAECGLICTRFNGDEGRQIIETQEIDGPISEQISQAMFFLERHLERNYEMSKNRLKGRTIIPQLALREAIVNAVVHRKYQIPARSKVAIFDDRVEIFSPGGLPGLITIENLGDGSSHLRNPLLAKFARRMRLAEKLGSGVRAMIEACAKDHIVPPEFFEGGDYVKVVFSMKRLKNPATSLQKIVEEIMNQEDVFRVRDILERTTASRNTITNLLNKLAKKKIIKRHGKGAGVYYKKL